MQLIAQITLSRKSESSMTSHRSSKLSLTQCTTLPGTVLSAVVSAPTSPINPKTLFSSTGVKWEFYCGKLNLEQKACSVIRKELMYYS